MTIQPGEFWVAEIRFTDGLGSKKRPVLVLWLDGSDAVIAAVTSAAARSSTDVPLADWRTSGLRTASTVRLSRLDCLEQALLIGRIGTTSPNDAQAIKQAGNCMSNPGFDRVFEGRRRGCGRTRLGVVQDKRPGHLPRQDGRTAGTGWPLAGRLRQANSRRLQGHRVFLTRTRACGAYGRGDRGHPRLGPDVMSMAGAIGKRWPGTANSIR